MNIEGSKYLIKSSGKLVICLFLLCALSSCGSKKFLKEDQSLVTKNSITILDPDNVNDTRGLKLQLGSFVEINPNDNFFFFFPKEGFYFRNQEVSDTNSWHRFIKRDIAQPPSFYDEDAVVRSAESMELFLRNLKGYYHASVSYESKTTNKSSTVNYKVTAGKRYHIDTIGYVGFDKELKGILENIKDQSIIKKGDPVDVNLFELEKQRISNYLQNIGYANFKSNRLKIYGDSSNLNRTIDVFFEIISNPDGSAYKKYTVGDINVYTDYFQGQELENATSQIIDSVSYHRFSKNFIVKPKQLSNFISFHPGKPFSESDRIKTFKKLNSLDVYKFSTLKPRISSASDSILNFDIFLTPQKAKWIFDYGLEAFYSTISNGGRRLIGASTFVALENKNLFGGAERNRINVEFSGDLNININKGLASSTIRVQDNLDFPTFKDFFKTGALVHKFGLLTDNEFFDFKREARTNINVGFSSQKIALLYDILSFNASLGYTYLRNTHHRFSVRQLALNLNSYKLTEDFKDGINDNEFIINSLEDNLLTGFLFRDFNYSYKSSKSLRGNSYQFFGNIEFSGWEIALANGLGNAFSNQPKSWKLFGEYNFSKFYRVELDGRYYHDFSKSNSFASRLNFAFARPFYDSNQIPFIKQFYVGGPSGIRAWQIRELGPGSYDRPLLLGQTDALFFQQGDLKLQFSAEYRFDIIPWIESALFIDGGNVWTLDDSDDRLGSQFSSKFLNDIALGYGWGIRFDFDYFLIRFDFGYKLRRPLTNDQKERWIGLREQNLIGNINIAINYPF